tara:strand:- start:1536 stop:2231 length:696 start_codon:yes stop_codon:yes gene_type:complete
MVSLTIIIPVYNETNTIIKIINKIKSIKISKQIIVVDDFSNDGTRKKLIKLKSKVDKLIFHDKNLGKGAAIRTAQKYIKGKFVIIQDADLEYDPRDYLKIIKKLKKKKIKVVYGSRVLGKKRYFLTNFTSINRIFFNHILTILSNILNKQKLTDAHTCYKAFDSKIFKMIKLEEKGFAFCPEITTKISNLNLNIIEVPIFYNGRNYKEGKKISYLDGIEAVFALIKYKISK